MKEAQKWPPVGMLNITEPAIPGTYAVGRSKLQVVYPSDPIQPFPAAPGKTVFLAGSIEMGAADRWQDRLCEQFMNRKLTLQILNPRREDWDSSWEQSIENQNFVDQVNWELKGLETADLIVMYLQPGTISPISLLELGAFSRRHIIVYCPKGYFRKGNVDIFCSRNNIPVFETELEIVDYVDSWTNLGYKDTLMIPTEVISKAAKNLSWDFKEEPKPAAVKAFKLKDSKTGLFSTGGYYPNWTKKGKTWSAIGYLKSSLGQYVRAAPSVRKYNNIPESWIVVEIGSEGIKEYSARELHPTDIHTTK